jgi:hypothetical protein
VRGQDKADARNFGAKGFIREFFECAKCNHFWMLDAPDPGQQAGGRIIGKKPE